MADQTEWQFTKLVRFVGELRKLERATLANLPLRAEPVLRRRSACGLGGIVTVQQRSRRIYTSDQRSRWLVAACDRGLAGLVATENR